MAKLDSYRRLSTLCWSLERIVVTEGAIFDAETDNDFLEARLLFEDYADGLDIALDFQNFQDELERIDEMYRSPRGCLLLARHSGAIAGCVGLRPFEEDICEMKRLYVRPEARGLNLGRDLATAVIARARRAGYRRMVLDTLRSMKPALGLYRSLGFYETVPYYPNPIEDAVYLALDLGEGL